MTWPHIMLDLETMGNGPTAAIVAVCFDVERGLGPEFYKVVDLQSSIDAGGVVDGDTVMWWLRQNPEARQALTGRRACAKDVLLAFFRWFVSVGDDDTCVWGNGATFDNVIIRTAVERSEVSAPWSFRNDRCYRTLRALYPNVVVNSSGICHHALDDAKHQAAHAIELLKEVAR